MTNYFQQLTSDKDSEIYFIHFILFVLNRFSHRYFCSYYPFNSLCAETFHW